MKKLILFFMMAFSFTVGNLYAAYVGQAPPGDELVPVISGHSYELQSPINVELIGLYEFNSVTVQPTSTFIDRHLLRCKSINRSLTSCIPKLNDYAYIDRHRLWDNNMPNLNAVKLTGSLHNSIAFKDLHRRLQQNIA